MILEAIELKSCLTADCPLFTYYRCHAGMMSHPPIPINELAEHIELLKANDNLRLSQEYEVNTYSNMPAKSLPPKILFNTCTSVHRLYVHDLFSTAIYFCNCLYYEPALFPLSSNARLNVPPRTLNVFVCAASSQSIDPSQQFTWEHSNLEVNKSKNRYANVIAYDHTRVVLAPIEGEDYRGR